jgi:type II secretory pathway component PulK
MMRILDFGFWILDCRQRLERPNDRSPLTLSDPIQNPKSKIQNPRARRGSALISAIMVLLVLVGLVAAVAPLVRVDVRATGQAEDDQRALYLARGGVNLALATLMQDDTSVDGLDEDWYTLGSQGQNVYPLGMGQVRLDVVDACSRIDLNQANQAALMLLPGMDETTASEILAWRGANGANNGTSNSSEDYESLPRPYRLKAAPFDSVEELLLVQGVTPLLLYGPEDGTARADLPQAPWIDLLFVDTTSPNTGATLTAGALSSLTPPQARAIAQRVASGSITTWAGLIQAGVSQATVRGLIDRYKIASGAQVKGKLNVNTASAQALETLPGVTEDVAQQIIQHRQSTGDYTSLRDAISAMTGANFSQVVDHITTKSSEFLIRARGELPNGTVRAVEAWVTRTGQTLKITRWRVVPRTPGWGDWGWESAVAGSSGVSPTTSTRPN